MKFNFPIAGLLILFLSAALVFSGCKKDDILITPPTPAAPNAPSVTATNAAGGITGTSATSGGTVSSTVALTATGVVWSSTSIQPTIADNSTNVGTVPGSFVSNISGLTPNTLYYVKAYATNSAGTSYGPRISFTTLP
ncbi:MAG: hypothetical protein WKF88_03630 [Ferruginibacter sp.]